MKDFIGLSNIWLSRVEYHSWAAVEQRRLVLLNYCTSFFGPFIGSVAKCWAWLICWEIKGRRNIFFANWQILGQSTYLKSNWSYVVATDKHITSNGISSVILLQFIFLYYLVFSNLLVLLGIMWNGLTFKNETLLRWG